jgi:mono/diheme cytochrome c family protein
MNQREDSVGRARPPAAPGHPQREKVPHDRPLWLRPEDEIFFITICCQQRGRNQLCRPNFASAIFDSIEFRNRNQIWYGHLVILMPDRLHALISFPFEKPMKQIIGDWKRFLATKLKINWQRDFFDHRLRRDESENNAYIKGDAPYAGAPGGRALPIALTILCLFTACRPDMMNQPRAKPLSESEFFSNGTSARQPPLHTVARGETHENAAFYTGLKNGVYITQLPVKLTPELLDRGRERFDAICAECHDRVGSGNGMVVQRGFPQPPSLHVDRLRSAPIGHFFDVITNGYGVMYSYATRVQPEDRWAIAAYIRALQLSHHVKLSDLDPTERAKLEGAK